MPTTPNAALPLSSEAPEASTPATPASEAPATPSPEAKPAAKRGKPAPKKPAAQKPAAKPAQSQRDADRERAQANRAIVAPVYNGPSLAAHNSVPPKLADALDRVANPRQRANALTTRDESALLLAAKHADKANTFCPVQATADIGTLSRVASLGHFAVAGQRIRITDSGLAAIAKLRKREASVKAATAAAAKLTS